MKHLAEQIVQILRQNNFKAYFCGGCVRDLLLKKAPKDYDIVSDASPKEIMKIFPKTIAVGAQFGVVKVIREKEFFEIATFRSDGEYEDGRRPTSVTFCGEEEDAKRRDFTINGLFLDPIDNKIIDYVHGQDDIKQRVIRTIGSPQDRFSEDYLRLLRAIRFSCQLDFDIEKETWEGIIALYNKITQVSRERIRDEFVKTLLCSCHSKAFKLLYESKLLEIIFPEILESENQNHSSEETIQYWVKLFTASKPTNLEEIFVLLLSLLRIEAQNKIVKNICNQWRVSKKSETHISQVLKIMQGIPSTQSMDIPELKRFLRQEFFIPALQTFEYLCSLGLVEKSDFTFCNEQWNKHKENLVYDSLITGKDLHELKIPPGPVYKEILTQVESLQLKEQISTKEEAIAWIKNNHSPTE